MEVWTRGVLVCSQGFEDPYDDLGYLDACIGMHDTGPGFNVE